MRVSLPPCALQSQYVKHHVSSLSSRLRVFSARQWLFVLLPLLLLGLGLKWLLTPAGMYVTLTRELQAEQNKAKLLFNLMHLYAVGEYLYRTPCLYESIRSSQAWRQLQLEFPMLQKGYFCIIPREEEGLYSHVLLPPPDSSEELAGLKQVNHIAVDDAALTEEVLFDVYRKEWIDHLLSVDVVKNKVMSKDQSLMICVHSSPNATTQNEKRFEHMLQRVVEEKRSIRTRYSVRQNVSLVLIHCLQQPMREGYAGALAKSVSAHLLDVRCFSLPQCLGLSQAYCNYNVFSRTDDPMAWWLAYVSLAPKEVHYLKNTGSGLYLRKDWIAY